MRRDPIGIERERRLAPCFAGRPEPERRLATPVGGDGERHGGAAVHTVGRRAELDRRHHGAPGPERVPEHGARTAERARAWRVPRGREPAGRCRRASSRDSRSSSGPSAPRRARANRRGRCGIRRLRQLRARSLLRALEQRAQRPEPPRSRTAPATPPAIAQPGPATARRRPHAAATSTSDHADPGRRHPRQRADEVEPGEPRRDAEQQRRRPERRHDPRRVAPQPQRPRHLLQGEFGEAHPPNPTA